MSDEYDEWPDSIWDEQYDCGQCGIEDGYPLMTTPDGRKVCVRCVKADPNLCGLEPLAVEVHEMMAGIAVPRPFRRPGR